MNPEPPNWELPPAPSDPPPSRPRGRIRLLVVALAIAVVGAAAGFVVTRANSITLASATVAKPSPSGSPSLHPPPFGRGGFGFPCASGFSSSGFGLAGGGCGGGTGTVTKISGSTLTLRTLNGTLTVTTSASTKYSREGKQVNFAAITVGEVLQVRGARGTSKAAASPLAATAITIEIPTVMGRVQSVSGNTITLVTSNGQLEYVTTSSATVYQGARNATATNASVKAGVFIVAQGTETDLTHITADGIQVLGSMTFAPHSFPGHPGDGASPRPSPATSSI
jgi:Domain of unknown function (DUF5666)